MFARQLLLATLLLGAVPAGCLPLITVGGTIEEIRAARNPPRGRHPDAAKSGWIFVAIMAVLSLVTVTLFHRQLRRTRDPEKEFAFGLGHAAMRLLLWIAFGLGILMGGTFILTVRS